MQLAAAAAGSGSRHEQVKKGEAAPVLLVQKRFVGKFLARSSERPAQ